MRIEEVIMRDQRGGKLFTGKEEEKLKEIAERITEMPCVHILIGFKISSMYKCQISTLSPSRTNDTVIPGTFGNIEACLPIASQLCQTSDRLSLS